MDDTCRAPWTSISLDPRGEVRVCCQNQWLRLGNIQDTPLTEIWRGPELARLRERLLVDDYRLGCDECRVPIERGRPELAYLHNFDHLTPSSTDDPPWPVQLELALSNTCNLQCVMCNGELSSAIRARRERRRPLVSPYGQSFFEELDQILPHVKSINFLGGEPFLARESLAVMERLVELGVRPKCSVTTNGTILNDHVAGLIVALHMDVAVSVDGWTAAVLESIRVGIDTETFRCNVERFRALTAEGGGQLRLLFSLLRTNWSQFSSVLRWGDSLGVDVGLNRVEHPLHHSLVHGPLADIEQAVAAMDIDPIAGQLGQNRPQWDRNLADLRSLLEERRARGTPVSLHPVDGNEASAAAGGFVAHVVTDRHQIVVDVRTVGDPPVALDLDQLVGESLWRVVDVLTARLGDLLYTDRRPQDHEYGEGHTFLFRSVDGDIEVEASVDTRLDGSSRWLLRLR